MLDAFPIYHWFHNGNPYSGAEGGMRYVITPGKKADPNDENGKKKLEYLTAQIWPGPWSIEHTAEEKIETAEFDGNQAGLMQQWPGCRSATGARRPAGKISPPFWTASRTGKVPAANNSRSGRHLLL